MNPGTTLFIIIGVIGLLLYVVKAIRESAGVEEIKTIKAVKAVKAVKADKAIESFTSYEQNGVLSSKPLGDINSLMNAFGTPDIGHNNNSMANALNNLNAAPMMPSVTPTPSFTPAPSLSISASIPSLTAIPAPSDNVQIQAPVIPSVSEGLKALAPSLISSAQTISDTQGSLLTKNKNTESFAANDITSELMKNKINKKKPKRHVKKCPPVPDMSLYIRKDQIPCWGCVLK